MLCRRLTQLLQGVGLTSAAGGGSEIVILDCASGKSMMRVPSFVVCGVCVERQLSPWHLALIWLSLGSMQFYNLHRGEIWASRQQARLQV